MLYLDFTHEEAKDVAAGHRSDSLSEQYITDGAQYVDAYHRVLFQISN